MRTVRIADFIVPTDAEGPGARAAIWFAGCSLRCPGCCNQEMLDAKSGTEMTIAAVTKRIIRHRTEIEGITLLGGEPTEQARGAAEIARVATGLGLSVMLFSGRHREVLEADPDTKRLLSYVDILVDGPYDASQPDSARRWIGSRNQGLHFFTDRYAETDFFAGNTVEIRVQQNDGRLDVVANGWPDGVKRLFRKG